jgi:hypothetical protein
MTHPNGERPVLGGDEKEFVEQLGARFTPAPMTAAERVVFDEALWSRVERPRRRGFAIATAAVAAAAALFWLLVVPSLSPPGRQRVDSNAAVAAAWEAELFLSSDVSASADRDESAMLPEEYQVIASVFLGG